MEKKEKGATTNSAGTIVSGSKVYIPPQDAVVFDVGEDYGSKVKIYLNSKMWAKIDKNKLVAI